VSDDGASTLVVIALLGNVFSPHYAAARRAEGAACVDPLRFSAMNVALEGPGVRRWAFTERGRSAVRRSPDRLAIGPSEVAWEGGALVVTLDERSSPWGAPVRGTIRVAPHTPFEPAFVALDGGGRHVWTPIMPSARAEVRLEAPRLSFEGHAYVDTNAGDEPLEARFAQWSWWRAGAPGGAVHVGYHAELRSGARVDVSCEAGPDGVRSSAPQGPLVSLGCTRWCVARQGERGMSVVRTLEDSPFYARSLVRVGGALGVHETVSLDRFATWWVQRMIPYRMRREVTDP
jgi:carotenoid 1,2-hydratase